MFKKHYKSIVIVCGFLFIFVNLGLASTAFSVHQPYIVAIDGIGDTGGSLILSVRTLTSFIAMFIVDRYCGALGVRRGVALMSLSVFIGFMIFSFATSLPVFMFGAVFTGLGYGLGGVVAMTYLANRWFSSGIGSAVGIAVMGSDVASVIVPIVVVRIIDAASLSAAFTAEGFVALGIGALVFALVRDDPSELGLEKFEAKASSKVRKSTRGVAVAPAAERRLLLVAIVLVGIYCCCGMTYMSVLATSSGFDPAFAALLMSTAHPWRPQVDGACSLYKQFLHE